MKDQYTSENYAASHLTLYVGDWGTYKIPPDVVARAVAMSGKRALRDKRVRGAKYLNQWGKDRDAEEQTIDAIEKHHKR